MTILGVLMMNNGEPITGNGRRSSGGGSLDIESPGLEVKVQVIRKNKGGLMSSGVTPKRR